MRLGGGKLLLFLSGLIGLLALWQMLAFRYPTLVPGVTEIFMAGCDLFRVHHIELDIFATLRRTLIAFAIAVAAGVPLGVAIGLIPALNTMLSGPIDFVRSIPGFVLLPLALTLLKSGEPARIGVAAFGAGVVMVASASFGAAHLKHLRVEVAKVYGASRLFIVQVALRGVLPAVADGARISLSLSLILVTVSEIMLGASRGLGTRVNDSLSGFDLPQMYALIFLIGILGYALNAVARMAAETWAGYGRHL